MNNPPRDYNAEIENLRRLQVEHDCLRRAAQQELWNSIKADPRNWQWSADLRIVAEDTDGYRSYHRAPSKDGQYCRVLKRVIPSLVELWSHGGPSTHGDDWQEAGRWYGMDYYRTEENILTSQGGDGASYGFPCCATTRNGRKSVPVIRRRSIATCPVCDALQQRRARIQ